MNRLLAKKSKVEHKGRAEALAILEADKNYLDVDDTTKLQLNIDSDISGYLQSLSAILRYHTETSWNLKVTERMLVTEALVDLFNKYDEAKGSYYFKNGVKAWSWCGERDALQVEEPSRELMERDKLFLKTGNDINPKAGWEIATELKTQINLLKSNLAYKTGDRYKTVTIRMLVTEAIVDLFEKYTEGKGKYEFHNKKLWLWPIFKEKMELENADINKTNR